MIHGKWSIQKSYEKQHLAYWSFLLQEFDFEIIDKKGVKNVVDDHIFRIQPS